MPADTRSSRKAKGVDTAPQKEKCDTREGSGNAAASSPSSRTRKSERLKSGNSQTIVPSPLRRSERDKTTALMDNTHNARKRKISLNNEVGVEATQVCPRGKTETESNASSKRRKKIQASCSYRDLFKSCKEANLSDSAKRRRQEPCISSNSGGSTKNVPVADDDDLHTEEGICGEDCANSTSKADQGNLGSESYPGHKPLNSSVEVGSDSQTHALMGISSNADVNIEEKDSRLDALMDYQKNKCIICNLEGKLLYCGGKGCGRSCHPACLNSQWMDVDPGTWHCPCCTENKIHAAVHSVAEDIESILDVSVGNGKNSKGLFRTSPRNGPQLSPEGGGKTTSAPKSQIAISSELHDQQKSLHQVLKPGMAKLFLTLGLKENIQQMAERFLAYMMTNQRVIREPDTALQAFQISVCWIAALILSEELDHVESLSLAREHLNFNCDNDEAEYAFSKMRFSMTMFMRSERVNRHTSFNLVMGTGGLASEVVKCNLSDSTVSVQLKDKVAEGFLVQEGLDKQVLARVQTIGQTGEILKGANKINKNCEKKVATHVEDDKRYEVEKSEISLQGKRAKHDKKYKHEYDIICKINTGEADKSERLKNLEAKHRQKLDQLDSDMATALNGIEASDQANKEEGTAKEADCMMEFDSWIKSGLSDRLRSNVTVEENGVEVVPGNSSSLPGNNLKAGNANVPYSAENSESFEVAAVSVYRGRDIADNDAKSKLPLTAIENNHEAATFANNAEGTIPDALGVQEIHIFSAITTDEVEQIATSKNGQLSAENSALRTEVRASEEGIAASERCTLSRMEQLDETCSSTHTDSADSPSSNKLSAVQQFTNQHQVYNPPAAVGQEHVALGNRLNQSNNQHLCVEASGIQNTVIQDLMPSSDNSVGVTHNASDPAGYSLSTENAVPLDTTVSRPTDLTPPCLASCGVTENRLLDSSIPCSNVEARIQVDRRPLNRSVEMTPRPSIDSSFNPNSFQFENSMSSRCFPATISASYLSPNPVIEFDPLQRELARMSGESIQVSNTHEDMVSRLKLDCDKEIEDLEAVAQIRRKYGSIIQEADASFSQKKNELEHYKSKVVMNIALAEAFRCKCMNIDHGGAQRGSVVAGPSNLTQQLLRSQFARRSVLPATLEPQTASSPPTQDVNHSTVQSYSMPGTLLRRSGLPSSSGNRMIGNVSLPPPTPSMPVSRTLVRGMASMSQVLNNTTLRSQPLPPLPQHPTGSHSGPHGANTSARPMSLPPTSGSATELLMNAIGQSAARSNAAAAALPPLPEIARHFETWNLSEFETSPDTGQLDPPQTGGVATGLVCLSDGE